MSSLYYDIFIKFIDNETTEKINFNVLHHMEIYGPDLYDRITNIEIKNRDIKKKGRNYSIYDKDDIGINLGKLNRLPSNLKKFKTTGTINKFEDVGRQLSALFSSHKNLKQIEIQELRGKNTLVTLPTNLEYLILYESDIEVSAILPNSLKKLIYFDCGITYLPMLSNTQLTHIKCTQNKIREIPKLPDTVVELLCYINEITKINKLSSSLVNLECDRNKLTSLPDLPDSLENLKCCYNEIKILPKLPKNLKRLNAAQNKLIALPNLPENINMVDVYNNQIEKIGYLPAKCKLNIIDNKLNYFNRNMIDHFINADKEYKINVNMSTILHVYFAEINDKRKICNKKLINLFAIYNNNPIFYRIIKIFIPYKDVEGRVNKEMEKNNSYYHRSVYYRRVNYPTIQYPEFDRFIDVLDAVDKIGNWFLEVKYNPKYGYCQRRLKKECEEMYETTICPAS